MGNNWKNHPQIAARGIFKIQANEIIDQLNKVERPKRQFFGKWVYDLGENLYKYVKDDFGKDIEFIFTILYSSLSLDECFKALFDDNNIEWFNQAISVCALDEEKLAFLRANVGTKQSLQDGWNRGDRLATINEGIKKRG